MSPYRSLVIASALTLAACATPTSPVQPPVETAAAPPPVIAAAPVVPAGARAKICESPFRVGRHRAGAGAAMAMTVSSDGGWCGRSMTHDTYAFTGGNVVQPPQHGEARIRHLAFRSLIEYRATPGYTGGDSFSVTMLPGNSTYLVDVDVKP